ncbi:HAD-IIB family hydrolase [Marinobacter sp.]|uniref:HAD-IIB family hydrolase n=1 Tax=Marinobacter sp. TaxID=50741 RepID=UPI0034A1B937
MHIALQGCLKSGSIPYGRTADTGGHIRYLLELVEALSQRPEISHQIVVTRAFDAPHLGPEYARLEEPLGQNATLWRCRGASSEYLPKEALWRELPPMVDSLMARMRREGVHPDLIHAHYADAGVMAMRLKAAFGIPYVFTAHSLGAPKSKHVPRERVVPAELRRRIRFEELVLKNADGVIASSEHEARVQYGMYRHHDLHKTQVNPPGCDVNSFRKPASPETISQVDAELRRFLRHPDRPCLLAIARPVEKKNLCALVKAYGENSRLREQANLVIYAGTRRNIDTRETEARQVWDRLIQLIDEYDLYGDVAYPKHHEFEQVPAIYQWAAKRHGVFVNAALNEPFGLTLLEAAAAGMPVVATREGGPVDIIHRCQHGLLVPPTDIQAIANACQHLLEDGLAWKRYSACGHRNVDFYSWSRHAGQYLRDTGFLSHQIYPQDKEFQFAPGLLATDMDGTLLGHRDGLEQLKNWLRQNPHCLFVIATGRSLRDALRELETWGAPRPDILVADVGSSVYQFDDSGKPRPMKDWQRQLTGDWHRARCQRLLDDHPALVQQPGRAQSRFKLSYFIRQSRLVNMGLTARGLVNELEQSMAMAGHAARLVCSHGNLLDVLPLHSGKALAVDFIRNQYGIEHPEVVTAGDSGNDLDLLRHAAFGIAVANHTDELNALCGYRNIYWARAAGAAGIMEGLRYRRCATEVQAPLPQPLPQPLPSPLTSLDGVTEIKAGA